MTAETNRTTTRYWPVWLMSLALLVFVTFLLFVGSQLRVYPNESAVGLSKQDILAKFGEPDRVSITGSLKPVIFVFDETRKLEEVVKDDWRPLSGEEKTMSMDFDAFSQASPKDRQSMLMGLVRKSEKGDLPNQLKTTEDVKDFFPDVTIYESWSYEPTLFNTGAIVHFDDETGVCNEVVEDFSF